MFDRTLESCLLNMYQIDTKIYIDWVIFCLQNCFVGINWKVEGEKLIKTRSNFSKSGFMKIGKTKRFYGKIQKLIYDSCQ